MDWITMILILLRKWCTRGDYRTAPMAISLPEHAMWRGHLIKPDLTIPSIMPGQWGTTNTEYPKLYSYIE